MVYASLDRGGNEEMLVECFLVTGSVVCGSLKGYTRRCLCGQLKA